VNIFTDTLQLFKGKKNSTAICTVKILSGNFWTVVVADYMKQLLWA